MLATGHHSNAFATANNNGFDAAPVRRNSVGDQSTLERECRMYAEHIESLLADHPLLVKNGRELRLVVDDEEEADEEINEQAERIANLKAGQQGAVDAAIGKNVKKLLTGLRDGIVVSLLINALVPDTIPTANLHFHLDLTHSTVATSRASTSQQTLKTRFEVGENLTACVAGAQKLAKSMHGSIVVVNFGASDLLEMNPGPVLGLVWQLIRGHLMRNVNLVSYPQLIRLLMDGESLKELIQLKPEELLLRWFNFHLKRAEESPISNFSADLVNGVGYIHLLDQISPLSMDRTLLEEAAETTDPTARASLILAYASSMGCRRCITARDMVAGHQRLNLAFIAELFNHNVGIVLPSDEEVRELMNANELLRVENAALVERVHAYEMEVEALRENVAQRGVEVEETRRVMVEQREEAVRAGRDTSARIESEWRERAESLKTQYRQQTQALEQKHAADRATWHAETKLTADMLHDFLGRHGKATAMPGQLTGSHVRDMVMDVLALQDDKTREIHALEMKMKRLEHVNELIGDKVQEYAEGMIQGKKKKSSGMFGMFSKK